MSARPTKYRCSQCLMEFPVREKRYAIAYRGEYTRCSVPGCNQRFWHAASHHGQPARVGIHPLETLMPNLSAVEMSE